MEWDDDFTPAQLRYLLDCACYNPVVQAGQRFPDLTVRIELNALSEEEGCMCSRCETNAERLLAYFKNINQQGHWPGRRKVVVGGEVGGLAI